MKYGSIVLDLQFFIPLIQLWAGICLLFFHRPFLKRFPLRTQLNNISDEIDRLFNVESQSILRDESNNSMYLYTEVDWDEFFRNIKSMAALTFFYCIFLMIYLGIERHYILKEQTLYHSQDPLFLYIVNIAIIFYLLLFRLILKLFSYLWKLLKWGIMKVSKINWRWKYINRLYSSFFSYIKIKYDSISHWLQKVKDRLILPRNLRFFVSYFMPLLYICIIFVFFIYFEKLDPFATNGNHNEYKYLYIGSHKVFDASNIVVERTRLTVFTFITCITGALIIIARLGKDLIQIKRLEFKISKIRPEINYLFDARTKPVDQIESSLPEHLQVRLRREKSKRLQNINVGDSKDKSKSEKEFLDECITTIIQEKAEQFIKNSSKLLKVSPIRLKMRKEDEFTENQEMQLQLLLDERLNNAFKKFEESKVIIQIKGSNRSGLNNVRTGRRRFLSRLLSWVRRKRT